MADLFVSGLSFGLSVAPIASMITAAIVSHVMNKRAAAERLTRADYIESAIDQARKERDQARYERDQCRVEALRLEQIIANAKKTLGDA